MAKIRRTVFYSGRVQGVCFRATAREVATRFEVTGFVRNLSDGRVELVAEGEPEELDKLLAAVAEAMAGFLADTQVTDGQGLGEFTRFEIRY